jgi:micrococcal nuclease
VVALFAGCDEHARPERASVDKRVEGRAVAEVAAREAGEEVPVERVIDGDTIRVTYDGRSEPVRYIGVNTPETRHARKGVERFGPEATEANRRLVEHRRVRLVFDVEPRDRYGRLLAYVFLLDGTFVNARLVESGHAQVMTVPPNVRYQDLFLRLEREARAGRHGLWADETSTAHGRSR